MAHNPLCKIVHGGRVFVAYAVKEIVRRTGRARQNWARYLVGRLAGSGVRLEILLHFLTPAEVRAHVANRLPAGWSAAQAMWECLAGRLGIAQTLALGDGLRENVLALALI